MPPWAQFLPAVAFLIIVTVELGCAVDRLPYSRQRPARLFGASVWVAYYAAVAVHGWLIHQPAVIVVALVLAAAGAWCLRAAWRTPVPVRGDDTDGIEISRPRDQAANHTNEPAVRERPAA